MWMKLGETTWVKTISQYEINIKMRPIFYIITIVLIIIKNIKQKFCWFFLWFFMDYPLMKQAPEFLKELLEFHFLIGSYFLIKIILKNIVSSAVYLKIRKHLIRRKQSFPIKFPHNFLLCSYFYVYYLLYFLLMKLFHHHLRPFEEN